MPQSPKIEMLPAQVRAELDQRLVAQGFGGYDALAGWLVERGWQISKSALHRHGQRFKHRLAAIKLATEQARAIAESSPDDAGALNDALTRLVQERVFAVLVESEDVDNLSLAKFARAIADLGRASISQKEWAAHVREKLQGQVGAARHKIESAVRAGGGLTPEAEDAIRRALTEINV